MPITGDDLLQRAACLQPGEAIEFEQSGIVYWLIRPTAENLDELEATAELEDAATWAADHDVPLQTVLERRRGRP
jgi:hypothetical protein